MSTEYYISLVLFGLMSLFFFTMFIRSVLKDSRHNKMIDRLRKKYGRKQ